MAITISMDTEAMGKKVAGCIAVVIKVEEETVAKKGVTDDGEEEVKKDMQLIHSLQAKAEEEKLRADRAEQTVIAL